METQTTTADAAPLTFEQKIEKSSQVRSVTYDADKRIMSVIFKDQKDAAAAPKFMYEYMDFPPEKWAELQAADSIGSYLYRNVTRPINGELPYQFNKIDLSTNTKVN